MTCYKSEWPKQAGRCNSIVTRGYDGLIDSDAVQNGRAADVVLALWNTVVTVTDR